MALTMHFHTQFKTGRRTRKEMTVRDPAAQAVVSDPLADGAASPPTDGTVPPTEATVPSGNVPRISRLMALAIRFDTLLRDGVAKDYADLARLGGVTRARLTQIMNLLNLAPDIQEALLFLPRTTQGTDPICERNLRPLIAMTDWRDQRRIWTNFSETCKASS